MEKRFENRTTWRDYQARFRRETTLKTLSLRIRRGGLAIGGLLLMFLLAKAYLVQGNLPPGGETSPEVSSLTADPPDVSEIRKSDIQGWLSPGIVANLEEKTFDMQVDQDNYRIDTSLDPSLQTSLLKRVRSSDAEQMALVALDPDDGRVLAMVGVDQDNLSSNPCFDNHFPAASVFKIVTAAAAIEECDFSLDTTLYYNGGKYTLYKSQLEDTQNRYTNTISFRDSFAQSVNPVFGKIGAQYLGYASMSKYGAAFGFNGAIDFEVSLPSSMFDVSDESYHLAEIACGFNRTTTLTPLHGALIAAAVVNDGRLPEPTMIEQIVDETGREIYCSRPAMAGEAMSPQASELLVNLMTRTVSSGTCQKTFQSASKDSVLSKLLIGGKTGSIDNVEHTRRMDWFVGFAEEKNGSEGIAVAVVVGHGKYIGTRASDFARYAFRDYFKAYFTAADENIKQAG